MSYTVRGDIDQMRKELKDLREIHREIKQRYAELSKKHRTLEDEYWQVWQDFHRVVYLLPDQDYKYAPLRRLWEKYSENKVPWKARDYDAIKDDALTETGSTPY